tara:strand:+ start:620 stop:1159 length:540 start_codon:yes stop_codon:yes gene_type:complete
MAIINSYPTATPLASDLLIGTDTSTTPNSTKTFTVDSIVSLADASYIKSDKIQITTAQLKNLGSGGGLQLIDPGTNKIIQIYSIVFGISGNDALNNLAFPNDLEFSFKSSVGVTPLKYVIPTSIANRVIAPAPYYVPLLVAGEAEPGADLVLNTAAPAVETGTAVTSAVVYITYRIFDI